MGKSLETVHLSVCFCFLAFFSVRGISAPVHPAQTQKNSKSSTHKPPHGGVLIRLGEEVAHLEIIHDASAGMMFVFVLDSEAKKAAVVSEKKLQLVWGDNKLDLVEDPDPLDQKFGRPTSRFAQKDDRLKSHAVLGGQIAKVTVNGISFTNVRMIPEKFSETLYVQGDSRNDIPSQVTLPRSLPNTQDLKAYSHHLRVEFPGLVRAQLRSETLDSACGKLTNVAIRNNLGHSIPLAIDLAKKGPNQGLDFEEWAIEIKDPQKTGDYFQFQLLFPHKNIYVRNISFDIEAHTSLNKLSIGWPQLNWSKGYEGNPNFIYVSTLFFQAESNFSSKYKRDGWANLHKIIDLNVIVPNFQITLRSGGNQGNPPKITKVKAQILPLNVIFNAPKSGDYFLYVGGDCGNFKLLNPPNFPSISKAPFLTLGPKIAVNSSELLRSNATLRIQQPNISVSQSLLKERIRINKSGVQRIEIPQNIIDRSGKGLKGVLLLDSQNQLIAYFIDQTLERTGIVFRAEKDEVLYLAYGYEEAGFPIDPTWISGEIFNEPWHYLD